MANRTRVLICIGALWPGNDASGPNMSVLSMIDALHDEFEFLRVARDRPPGARAANVESGRWIETPHGPARYCPPGVFGARGLADILRATPHDLLLLNGFHDREFTIPALALQRFAIVPKRPTLLSPRGEFSSGALGLKPRRKAIYQRAARRLALLHGVNLHATSAAEAADMARGAPEAKRIFIAPNIRRLLPAPERRPAADARLRVAFLGRVTPVKNLDFALETLRKTTSPIRFDIYGPIEDASYWARCSALIDALPANVEARRRGEIANARVRDALADADILFLPSRSENFGHAIFEALCCGAPALIGDATPWRNLEMERAGWDLPLDDPTPFARVLDAFAALDPAARAVFHAGARALAERHARENDGEAATRAMFRATLAGGRACAA